MLKNIKVIIERYLSNIVTYNLNIHNRRDFTIWVFGEWFGRKCSDNTLIFANYVAHQNNNYKLYWISDKNCKLNLLDSSIKVIEKDSIEAKRILKKAGVAVMNQGYDDFSSIGNNYLGNAITVNLWHGIMWKKIGFDVYDERKLRAKIYINTIKKTKNYKLFEAPSDVYAQCFQKAFRLSEAKAINAGLPRNEIFFDDMAVKCARNKVLKYLKSQNSSKVNNETVIITYLPTFRDKQTGVFSFDEINDKSLFDYIKEKNVVILQKLHEVNVKRGEKYGEKNSENIFCVQNFPTQELLAATDILITDYSSCFFDFLLLDRKIIFYLYDYEYYSNKDRGLYYPKEEIVCGPVAFNEKELINAIKESVENDRYSNARKRVRKKYLSYESKNNCKIIYNAINTMLQNRLSGENKII